MPTENSNKPFQAQEFFNFSNGKPCTYLDSKHDIWQD